MKFDKAYVIGSKEFSPKRLKRFYKMIKSLNINVELWPAIYGLNIDINKYISEGYLTKNFKLKMPGSLGCLLSHITLWEHCINDQNCKIALILEDDVILNTNFIEKLNQISLNEIPSDWEIIKLSYNKVFGENFSNSFIKPKLNKQKAINAGSWCYLINTTKIQNAKGIIIPYDNNVSMDVIIRANIEKLNIFFTKEKLAIHDQIRYSLRKDINKPNNLFRRLFNAIVKKIYS